MIDLDAALYVEYDDSSKEPLALIETARDVGQGYKAATVTRNLAKLAGLPSYCVLYLCGDRPNPADPAWRDVELFRVKRLWPRPEREWRTLTPNEWAHALLAIRSYSTKRLDAANAAASVVARAQYVAGTQ
jgi:hypothetical protein